MRDKEEAHDYRYFPDPDLVPIYLSDEELKTIRESMPELPKQKKERFMEQFSLSAYDAGVLTSSKYTAAFFERCMEIIDEPKAVCNLIMVDLLKLLNENGIEPKDIPMAPEALCEVVRLTKENVINSSVAKAVFEEAFKTGKAPAAIVEEKGLKQMDDSDEIERLVAEIIAANPKPVADYQNGNKKAMTFFVGQVMKATKGKANPKTVNEIVARELNK